MDTPEDSETKPNVKGDSRLTESEVGNEAVPSNDDGTSEHAVGQPLMSTDLFSLVGSALRELGEDFYAAYADKEWQDRYEDVASQLIDKLSRLGIQLVDSKVQVSAPTNQKPDQTSPKDSK